jgi:hypothetical protein
MSTDVEMLKQMNIEIGEAETRGDHKWLAGVLAPELAFSRASGAVDDAGRYLQKVAGSNKRATEVESVEVLGNRAIVKCIVAQDGKKYHNLRLWIRREGKWLLLGWANEPV